jgi:hypothetical protein
MPQNIFKIDRTNVETLDLKMLLLIGGIVVLFFLFVYPMLTKKELFTLDELKEKAKNAYDTVRSTVTETFNINEKMDVDYTLEAGCAKPEEKKVETMSDVQKTTKIDAFGSLESPSGNTNIEFNKVDTQMCSKACCSPQWGQDPYDDGRIMANDLGTKYFTTNYMCNGENPGDKGNGCVCVTKDTFGYLGNRGGNNME